MLTTCGHAQSMTIDNYDLLSDESDRIANIQSRAVRRICLNKTEIVSDESRKNDKHELSEFYLIFPVKYIALNLPQFP